ncbi:MAG: hypothetical protein ABFE07_17830 [Armatimonadia bacterium]
MTPDNLLQQLRSAAKRGGLPQAFGEIAFDAEDIARLGEGEEGLQVSLLIASASGKVGVLFIELYDSGNPGDEGLTVGLRGWRLADDVAAI